MVRLLRLQSAPGGSAEVAPGIGVSCGTQLRLMSHYMQAESEIFRNGCCEDEDDGFEEYQRRKREAAKRAGAAADKPPLRAASAAARGSVPPEKHTVQETLEQEHERREQARERQLDKEGRFQCYVNELAANSRPVDEASPVVSSAELKEALKSNERAAQAESVDFVQSFR